MCEPGLHVLFGSSGNGIQDGGPEVDIVAVHGLNFKNNPNHPRATWTSQGSIWIRDFLPFRLQRSCRVMLFAYNSSPAMGAAAMRLDDHAKMLLQCLMEKREGAPQRPLIFLCHSLGGIVVKSALVEATLDRQYKSIVRATRLLVFFATPHLGGNYSGIGDVAAKIVRTGLGTPSNDLLDGLKAGSRDVIRRFEQGRHLPKGCLVISFYETENYGKLGLIVEKSSAILDLPEDREKQVALQANHSRVCKFPTAASAAPVMELISSELERALELQRALKPQLENIHWLVPRATNSLFTGREKIVAGIANALSPSNSVSSLHKQVFVLTGIGGQGKSEVCLNVLNQVRSLFWGVFWVDVSSRASATAGFTSIARVLGSETKDIDDILILLANCRPENNWLLVLDNADDVNIDYQDFIPSGSRNAILMSSRITDCVVHNTVGHEELGNLSEEECVTLLLKAARVPEESWAKFMKPAGDIAQELGFHTLALIQAGAYIAQEGCQFDEYTAQFQQQREKLLRFGPSQLQPRYRNVYATFEVSVQSLEASEDQCAQDALDLLEILSTLHYNDVPMEYFKDAWDGARRAQTNSDDIEEINCLSSWHTSKVPCFMGLGNNAWDSMRLTSASNELSNRALIKKNIVKGQASISLHPLIHSWIATRQDEEQRHSCIESSMCIIALARYADSKWRPHLQRLGPHVLSLMNSSPIDVKSIKTSQIFLQLCDLVAILRYDQELSHFLGHIFQSLNESPSNPKEKLLPFYYLLSFSQFNSGNVTESIDTIQRVLALQQSCLDEHHHDRLNSEQELARAYIATGQWSEATSILEKVRVIHEEHLNLPREDAKRVALLHHLGRAYHANGRTKEAISVLEEVVSIQRVTKDKGDPGQISSKYQLALAYVSNCQTEEGIALLREIDADQAEYLADNHPNRIGLQKGLAKAYLEDGQPEKAIELLVKVTEIQKQTLSEGDPEAIVIEHQLGTAYRMNGQFQYAIRIFQHIVKRWNGPANHHYIFAAKHDLAAAYLSNGQTKDAISIFEELGSLESTAIHSNHPTRIAMLGDLSRAYLQDGQITRSIELLKRTIDLQVTLNAENANTLALKHQLGSAYLANGQNSEAIEILEGLIPQQSVSRENDTRQLASQHELGRAYLANGQIKDAVESFERVVKRKRETHNENHPEVLASMHELARSYIYDGQIKRGIKICEEVVRVQKLTLRESHPDQLKSMRLLASAYLDDDQTTRAVTILSIVVELEGDQFHKGHPGSQESQYLLGTAYIKAGEIEKAITTMRDVVQAYQTTLPENHPTRLSAQHQLATAYMANGQIQDAIEIFRSLLVDKATSGQPENHPSRLASMHQLGSAYMKNRQPSEAVTLFEDVVRIQQGLKEDHPSRLTSEHELACCYLSLRRTEEAIVLFEEILRVQSSTLGREDPSRIITMASLASAYLSKRDMKKVIQMLEEVVPIRQRTQSRNNVQRLTSEYMLGVAYLEDKQDSKGIAVLEGIIGEGKPDIEEPHPLYLKTYYELGCAHLAMSKTKRAVELLEELGRLKRLHQNETYPSWDELRNTLATAHRANNFICRMLIKLGFSSCILR